MNRKIYTPFFRREVNIIYAELFCIQVSDSLSSNITLIFFILWLMGAFEWLNVNNRQRCIDFFFKFLHPSSSFLIISEYSENDMKKLVFLLSRRSDNDLYSYARSANNNTQYLSLRRTLKSLSEYQNINFMKREEL